MNAAGILVAKLVPEYMRCPSSPLPVMEAPAGPITLPTYVGIAGGCDIDPNSQDYQVSAPATWGADCWNITTVRYRPNYKRVLGGTPLPGCSENHGMNNPLQSPHPGGLHAAMTDGSVQFLSQTMDLAVLLRLAIRDDGQAAETKW